MLHEVKASRIGTLGGTFFIPTHQPLLSPGDISGTCFYWSLSGPDGRSEAGSVKSMEDFNDSNGNRTRDRPGCSAVRRRVSENLSVHYPNHMS
jgi:hypothetical protein